MQCAGLAAQLVKVMANLPPRTWAVRLDFPGSRTFAGELQEGNTNLSQ